MALKSMIYNEIVAFYDHNVHIPSRTIYLGNTDITNNNDEESEINAAFAAKAIKGLHLLDCLGTDPIKIILNGSGGDFYYAIGLVNFIQNLQSVVNIDAYGPVFSATSMLFQAATGERRMSKNSIIMIHYGVTTLSDYSKIVKSWSKEMDRTDLVMEDLYYQRIISKNSDFKIESLREMLNVDTILSAENALVLGLTDKVI